MQLPATQRVPSLGLKREMKLQVKNKKKTHLLFKHAEIIKTPISNNASKQTQFSLTNHTSSLSHVFNSRRMCNG
mgnify:CR=1 FL=1